MKTLIVVLMIYLMSVDLSYSMQVTTSGYGFTYSEAVTNAKMNATEKATNSFISSKQESMNGNFKEIIANYNGGFVRSIDVLDTLMINGQFKVTINADVDVDKINTVLSSSSDEISDKTISDFHKIMYNEANIEQTWKTLDEISDRFVVKIVDHSFRVNSNNVDASYKVALVWNPKWYDDAWQLSKATSIPKNDNGDYIFAMCFAADACFIQSKMPAVNTPEIIRFLVTMNYDVGSETKILKRNISTRFIATNNVIMKDTGLFSPQYNAIAKVFNKLSVNYFELDFSIDTKKFDHLKSITITPIKE